MRPERVVILALTDQGGMAHYAASLANSLTKLIEVHAIVGAKAARFFNEDVRVLPIDLSRSVSGKHANVKSALRSADPDLVHLTDASYLDVLLAPWLKRWPVVTTIHDVETHPGERTLANLATNRFHQWFGREWIVHGETSKRALVAHGRPAARVHVIPHGGYDALASPAARMPDGKFRALFFGRIVDYKGLPDFVDAVKAAHVQDARIVGLIAGRGSLAGVQSQLVGTDGYLQVRNEFVPESAFAEIFRQADVVVCPYRSGTQSGVIPLAYAHARPVIATRVGDLPDAVRNGETGFLVERGDTCAMAARLAELAADASRARRMGDAAKSFSLKELGWDAIANRTVDVYTATLEARE